MPCCPPNAEKFLAPDYSFVGQTHRLEDGNEFYHTGTPGSLALLLIPDIFGWNGGRTRNVADFFAQEGYYTVVPKLMVPPVEGGVDGDGFNGFSSLGFLLENLKRYPAADLLARIRSILGYMKAQGATKIHLMGFCWGGWVCSHVLSTDMADEFLSCAIPHPSITLEAGAHGGDVAKLVESVRKPMLLLPARGDPAEYNEGGAYFELLKARNPTSATIPFPEVDHGFVPRGDVSIPFVRQEVDRALAAILSFYQQHA